MIAELKRGLVRLGQGAQGNLRGDATSALVMTQGHGDWTELSAQGSVMIASTAVAGVAPGTALSTTPPMAIWNPPGSGFNLALLKTVLGYVSGTLGAGSIVYAQVAAQTTVPTGGAELTPVCSMLGFPRGVGRAFQGSTLTGTPTIVKPAYQLPAFAGAAAVPTLVSDLLDGEIIVSPGTVFVMQGVAGAGTTPLALFGVVWEEFPVV